MVSIADFQNPGFPIMTQMSFSLQGARREVLEMLPSVHFQFVIFKD